MSRKSLSAAVRAPVHFTGKKELLKSFTRKVDTRLPGKRNLNSHGARPVHLIIAMIKWIQTSRLPIKNSLCPCRGVRACPPPREEGTPEKV